MYSAQLSPLLKESHCISESLVRIKQDILYGVKHGEQSASDYLEEAIQLRMGFRALADSIEARRAMAQLQKYKIEHSKNYFYGLQYYKTTLLNNISSAQVYVVNLEEYLEHPLEPVDWVNAYQQGEDQLKQYLKLKRSKRYLFQQKLQEKNEKLKEYSSKNYLYEKVMPTQVKKIQYQIYETARLFQLEDIVPCQQIAHAGLRSIHDLLLPLKNTKAVHLYYHNEQHEYLEIVINKSEYRLYKLANCNKLPLLEKNIKVVIAALGEQEKLVVGVDRREDFTTEEVFDRLVLEERVKEVFPEATTEFQRNINNKYMRVDWVEGALANGIVNAPNFIAIVRERVFCLQLVKHLLENFRRMSFYFPLALAHELTISKEATEGNRLTILQPYKISFQYYLKQSHQPNWLSNYLNNFSLYLLAIHLRPLYYQLSRQVDRSNVDAILRVLHLYEANDAGLNSYYRCSLEGSNLKLIFVVILPRTYPKNKSVIRVLEYGKKKYESLLPCGIPVKLVVPVPSRRFTEAMRELYWSVNEEIDTFARNDPSGTFRLLFQLNRLLYLIGEGTNK